MHPQIPITQRGQSRTRDWGAEEKRACAAVGMTFEMVAVDGEVLWIWRFSDKAVTCAYEPRQFDVKIQPLFHSPTSGDGWLAEALRNFKAYRDEVR